MHTLVKSCATLALAAGLAGHATAQEVPLLNGKPYMPLQIAYVTKTDATQQTITVCFSKSGQCNTLHQANFHGTAAACTQPQLNAIVKAAFTPKQRQQVKEVGDITTLIAAAYPDSYPARAAFYDCPSTPLAYWQGVLCLDNDITGILTTCGYVADNPKEVKLLPYKDVDGPDNVNVSSIP